MVSGSSYYSDWDDATSVVTASTNTRARIEDLERSLNYERQQREETEKRLRELQERQDQIMRELDRNNGRSSHPQSYAPTNSGRDSLTGRLRRAEDDLALLRMSMHSQEADMMLDDALEGTAYVNRPISRTKYITDYRGCLLPSHF
jgi:chromosome segregation ATPase